MSIRHAFRAVALLVVGGFSRVACAGGTAVMLPSDLGATLIEVSAYPGDLQWTYHHLFLTKCTFCHTAARAINAPYLELPAEQVPGGSLPRPVETSDGVMVSDSIWRS